MGSVTRTLFGGGSTAKAKLGKHEIDATAFDDRNAENKEKIQAFSDEINRQRQAVDQTEARREQSMLALALSQQARGLGPSLIEGQLKKATNRNLAQQLALAASTRGGNTAATQRDLMRNQAATNQELARQSADARIQEQLQARQQLGDVLNQQRQQDIVSTQGANQIGLQTLGQLAQLNEQDRAAKMALEQMRLNQFLGVSGIKQQGASAQAQSDAAVTGGLIGGVGAAIGFSDEKLKKDKEEGSDSAKKFLDSMESLSSSFNYGQPAAYSELQSGISKGIGGLAEGIKKMNAKKMASGAAGTAAGPSMGASAAGPMRFLASISDERKKTDIDSGSSPTDKFLDALEAKTWRYKDPEKFGEGKHLGVMAQDLEKAGPIGKSMVIDTPEGKMVDYGKGFGAILASQAELNKRLEKLEKTRSKRRA